MLILSGIGAPWLWCQERVRSHGPLFYYVWSGSRVQAVHTQLTSVCSHQALTGWLFVSYIAVRTLDYQRSCWAALSYGDIAEPAGYMCSYFM